ncbi:MAG: divalent-cation tolerance protein CutA [Alphaproteobacteria bacterium]|nr:divalent-cation tolerance protein CutA [Alphaproteobacteria bacterium]MCY4231995.1 divalent-cation tolerance protein CutA [Alphaproteobacteria bacterium]MCY4319129.1 divalent-cation tolerance protein CutA [Alphaproteobacteria bacterium]
MSRPCLLYMTAGDREEALALAHLLVGERLAACANVIGAATSVYRWQGAVQEEDEVVLVAKTVESRVEAAVRRVRTVHSYDTPCVVAVPISGGDAAFLSWVQEEAQNA